MSMTSAGVSDWPKNTKIDQIAKWLTCVVADCHYAWYS